MGKAKVGVGVGMMRGVLSAAPLAIHAAIAPGDDACCSATSSACKPTSSLLTSSRARAAASKASTLAFRSAALSFACKGGGRDEGGGDEVG